MGGHGCWFWRNFDPYNQGSPRNQIWSYVGILWCFETARGQPRGAPATPRRCLPPSIAGRCLDQSMEGDEASNWGKFGRDRPWFCGVISRIRFASGEMFYLSKLSTTFIAIRSEWQILRQRGNWNDGSVGSGDAETLAVSIFRLTASHPYGCVHAI